MFKPFEKPKDDDDKISIEQRKMAENILSELLDNFENAVTKEHNLPENVFKNREIQNGIKHAIVSYLVTGDARSKKQPIDTLKNKFNLSNDFIQQTVLATMAISIKPYSDALKNVFNVRKESFNEVIESERLPKGMTLNDSLQLRDKGFGTDILYNLGAFSFENHIKLIVSVLSVKPAESYFIEIKVREDFASLSDKDIEFITKISVSYPEKALEILKKVPSIEKMREIVEGHIENIQDNKFVSSEMLEAIMSKDYGSATTSLN